MNDFPKRTLTEISLTMLLNTLMFEGSVNINKLVQNEANSKVNKKVKVDI